MKIEILCRDGSPLQVTEKSIFGEDGRMGVGGAELALLTMCKGWHDRGDEVILYNDPKVPNGSCFEQRPVSAYSPQSDRDVIINFRSPSPDKIASSKGLKVWWSCDQFTIDNYSAFAPMMQKIVVISPFHDHYFRTHYGIQNSIVIDLPVRIWEYDNELEKGIERVPKRCIFTSMPDRGLYELAPLWRRIVDAVPEAHLVVTSDQRLWGEGLSPEHTYPYRAAFGGLPSVTYHGAVNRRHLVQLQLEAELHLYTCIYEELFCIAVAESQVAGAYPITSGVGSLSTTNMGKIIEHMPTDYRFMDAFVECAVSMLNGDIKEQSSALQQKARERFSLENILEQWDERIFK